MKMFVSVTIHSSIVTISAVTKLKRIKAKKIIRAKKSSLLELEDCIPHRNLIND